jgi:hypothetical protein
MSHQKTRLMLPLACCAIVSVTTFSGIGIAAITGQLPVSAENNPSFLAKDELKKREGLGNQAVTSTLSPTHVGLTRSATEGDKPMILHSGQTLAPLCSTCGVVDSIEQHDLQMPTSRATTQHLAAATTGMSNTGQAFAASVLAGSNRSVYSERPNRADIATSFIVRLRMENGSLRTIYEHQPPEFSVGEKVKLINGSVVSMNS